MKFTKDRRWPCFLQFQPINLQKECYTTVLLSKEEAEALQTPRNETPQGYRDALLMSLLLKHGLRASEIALLTVDNIDLANEELRFFRPKVQGTEQEWTTHRLMAETKQLSS